MTKRHDAEPRRRLWRVAFLAGVAILLAGLSLALGTSRFPAFAGLVTLIIGVVNSLLAGPSQNTSTANPLASFLRDSLTVTRFLKCSTVLVWIAALSFLSAAAVQQYFNAQLITVEGHVLTPAGDPADNALVTFFAAGSRHTASATAGHFRFSNIKLARSNRKSAVFQAHWRDSRTSMTLDLSGATSRTGIVLRLSPEVPPFRISYFFLSGHAIDLFTRGRIEHSWLSQLAGQPFVVPNAVFDGLTRYVKAFTNPFRESYFEVTAPVPSRPQDDDPIAKQYHDQPFFVGSWWSRRGFQQPASREVLQSLLKSDQQWNMEFTGAPIIEENPDARHRTLGTGVDLTSFYFWRPATSSDFEEAISRHRYPSILSFLRHVTGGRFPPNLGLIVLRYIECPGYMDVNLRPRYLRLRLLLVENVTAQPMHIGRFYFRENRQTALRTYDEDNQTLREAALSQDTMFPQEALRPGERIVIPLEMSLTFHEGDDALLRSLARRDLEARLRARTGIERVGKVDLPYDIPNRRSPEFLTLPLERLRTWIDQPKEGVDQIGRPYVVGPSTIIDGIEIAGSHYTVRQFEPSHFVLLSGSPVGSCPYIYTYSERTGSWIREGHILYGNNRADKQGTSEIELRRFDGRIQVREEDPEVSYIDTIYIRAIGAEGKTQRLYPRSNALRLQDGKHLVLQQGEQIEIEFEPFQGGAFSKYVLSANGYYLPSQ